MEVPDYPNPSTETEFEHIGGVSGNQQVQIQAGEVIRVNSQDHVVYRRATREPIARLDPDDSENLNYQSRWHNVEPEFVEVVV